MAETFQVIGGALATVDLALKLYKEIARFRIKVRQADDVGKEMSMRYDGLTTTLGDVHSALKRRKDQLVESQRAPDEGEARVWFNIHKSLRSMRRSLKEFARELEKLDGGRDVREKRKWIDRAIWQLKVDKKQPVFQRLDDAANTRIKELTLSIAALQVFMHSESTSTIEQLALRIAAMEESLRKLSTASMYSPMSPTSTQAPAPPKNPKASQQRQLKKCLRDAHEIVNKRRKVSRVDSVVQESQLLPQDDPESVWNGDTDSLFSLRTKSSQRRPTFAVPPDAVLGRSSNLDEDVDDKVNEADVDSFLEDDDSFLENDDDSAGLFDVGDDDDDDDDDELDDSSEDEDYDCQKGINPANNTETHTEVCPVGPNSEACFDKEQSSESPCKTSGAPQISSTLSAGCMELEIAERIVVAVEANDAKRIERILRGKTYPTSHSIPEEDSTPPTPTTPTSPTSAHAKLGHLLMVRDLPILHHAIKSDADPAVLRALLTAPCSSTCAPHPSIDINAREPAHGMSPLHFAVKYDCYDSCVLLADLPGITLDARDRRGLTPLALALSFSDAQDADAYAVCEALLKRGAKLPEKSQMPKGLTKNVDDLCRSWRKRQDAQEGRCGEGRKASWVGVGEKRRQSGDASSTSRKSSASSNSRSGSRSRGGGGMSLRKTKSGSDGMGTRGDGEVAARKRGLSLRLRRSSSAKG